MTFKKISSLSSLFILLAVIFIPGEAYAISFPAVPGVTATDDPITIFVKFVAYGVKALVYMVFAVSFLVAGWVAVATLLKMLKDRENAGDLIGRLAASVLVIVAVTWFLSQGETAAEDLKNISSLSYIETSYQTV